MLTGYARHFMGTRAVGNVTWAWIAALSVIVLTWAITFAYGRFADRRLHPLVERTTGRAGGEPRP